MAAYHRRNRRLAERADLLVGFTDGRQGGDTAATIGEAHLDGINVFEVRL